MKHIQLKPKKKQVTTELWFRFTGEIARTESTGKLHAYDLYIAHPDGSMEGCTQDYFHTVMFKRNQLLNKVTAPAWEYIGELK